MSEEAKKTENKIEKIPIKELVDLRCQGASFDVIADIYGVSKMGVYLSYMKAKEHDFYGYEPYSVEMIKASIRGGRKTVQEIAAILNIPYKGLRMYMTDRGITREINARKVRSYIERGKTIGWLATFYGMSRGTFNKWLKENCPDLVNRGGDNEEEQ